MTGQGKQVKRPRGRPAAGRNRFNITLRPETSERLWRAVKKTGTTRSTYIEQALQVQFRKDGIT
jgi:hypothetical protein